MNQPRQQPELLSAAAASATSKSRFIRDSLRKAQRAEK
jgi:hypothetical protein